jgi:ketosteroid isomerase-like protein
MSQENVELVRRGYEHFAAGDMDRLSDLFAPDAELADAGGLGVDDTAVGIRLGFEGFVRASEEVQEAFDDYRVEPEEFIDAGNAVVVLAHISGRGRASGMTLDTRLAHLWVFRGDKVVRGEVYRTAEEALEAARTGGEPDASP